ncbi:MAG: purine-binding chemotaxis protein CheW [Marinobacter excellens HL-55]|uniref:Purine-binding chemotaxis protein CheW n=1 Tax=Marinobacter excellens HL-55 TaxID=1305731 RepID=A0A0P7YF51_9GAMM|nr:MAG: purine-binding chemotaxis protein CheW [Marinobacter excellens HL-55]
MAAQQKEAVDQFQGSEKQQEKDSAVSDFLTFSVDEELFAIEIMKVKEILEYSSLTSVPLMPPFIRGVINLRGSVVPVVDLKVRFGGDKNTPTKRTCFVIVEVPTDNGYQEIGILVDTVSEVLSISSDNVEPPPSFGAKIRADFIQGMGKLNGSFVIILCVDKVLSVEELADINGFVSQNSKVSANA